MMLRLFNIAAEFPGGNVTKIVVIALGFVRLGLKFLVEMPTA